ncbi:MAG: hypothetical protein JO345_23530 [Streptosporangiaceae bacterium]|nr:hypothetical protein [Streptosporangiaceae bacterium]
MRTAVHISTTAGHRPRHTATADSPKPSRICAARSHGGVPGEFTPSARSPESRAFGIAYRAAATLPGSAITNGAQPTIVTPAAQPSPRRRASRDGSASSSAMNPNAHGFAPAEAASNAPVSAGRPPASARMASTASSSASTSSRCMKPTARIDQTGTNTEPAPSTVQRICSGSRSGRTIPAVRSATNRITRPHPAISTWATARPWPGPSSRMTAATTRVPGPNWNLG